MYSKYNLKANANQLLLELHNCSDAIMLNNKSINGTEDTCLDLKNFIKNKVKNGGILTSDDLENEWFPELRCQIFISHSHIDEKTAQILKKWLRNNLGIDAFIDSEVWLYSKAIITEIVNEKFNNSIKCDQLHEHYKFTLETSAKVNMILVSALTKMIDNTECLLFLNTNNSINTIDGYNNNYTYSPWLFYELFISKLIKPKSKEKHRVIKKLGFIQESSETNINYPIDLGELVDINVEDLKKWSDKHKESDNKYALDTLYEMKPMG